MKKIAGIYKIVNLCNNKVYIGSSVNLQRRLNTHKNALLKNKHDNAKLQRAYNKYGKDNFIFEVIEILEDNSILLDREQYYLDFYDSYNNGYNARPKAENNLNYIPSEEIKSKISKTLKGIKRPPMSDEHKKKLSSTFFKKGQKPHNKNKKMSENVYNKCSKTFFKKGHSNGFERKVINLDTGEIFNSIKEAKNKYKVSHISCVCRGVRSTAGGYRWKYLEECYNGE